MNMDHIMFAIHSASSTISMLSTMDQLEAVRCFGTHVNALWNIILYKERYIQYPNCDTVKVLYFDEYGSHYVRNTFGPFHHIYIIDDGSTGWSEMLWNPRKRIMEYYFTQGTIYSVPEARHDKSAPFRRIWITLCSQYVRPLPPYLCYRRWLDRRQ